MGAGVPPAPVQHHGRPEMKFSGMKPPARYQGSSLVSRKDILSPFGQREVRLEPRQASLALGTVGAVL